MKTQTITYTYDPTARSLTTVIDGRPRGGFWGPEAERRFNKLLESGAEISITNMDTENIKKTLIRRFHAALSAQGILMHKESILSAYGVSSSTELSIDQLKQVVATYTGNAPVRSPEASSEVRTMRSELLTICNKMGLYVTNDDWNDVNRFFENPRIAGKRLNKLSLEELTALVPKMRSMLTKHIKAQREINRQKRMN